MLTEIDSILFPDDCEVVEMPLHNQWVYLIQKNGSSSLRNLQKTHGLTLLANDHLQQLDFVDVYIRDAKDRYVSGVNTYLQHLKRDHPELDQNTAFWFAKQYKFLNKHYLPQFHWLLNLSRYLSPHAKIRIRDFRDFNLIATDHNNRAGILPSDAEFAKKLLDNNAGLELWLFMDQILLDLAGEEMTWTEIINHYCTVHTATFDIVCQHIKVISKSVLP
jgi:hypothetical protein